MNSCSGEEDLKCPETSNATCLCILSTQVYTMAGTFSFFLVCPTLKKRFSITKCQRELIARKTSLCALYCGALDPSLTLYLQWGNDRDDEFL